MAFEFEPISWETVEDALHAWITNVLGVEVVWEDQSEPQPSYPFVSMDIIGPVSVGHASQTIEQKTDGSGALIDEYQERTRGEREITVTLQINVAPPESQNANTHARSRAEKVLASLELRRFCDPLYEAGLSLIQPEAVTDLSLVVADKWIDRRGLDVRFRLASNVVDDIEIIESATLTGEVTGTFDGTPLQVGPEVIDSKP